MFAAVLIYVLAVMSPGSNFILVSRFAASNSILAGIGASVGIWMVGLLFSTSSVLGLAVMIHSFPKFGALATIAGSIYLLYIAFILLRSALRSQGGTQSAMDVGGVSFGRAWKMGVLTNITNMKTIAFMISIFASFLATSSTATDKATVIAICSTFEIAWYSSVALIFGQGLMQRMYFKYSRQIASGLGVFLIGFALQNTLALSL